MKKKTPKKLREELWNECKRIIRARYIRDDGMWNCYTCDKLIAEPAKAHTAHFIPSASCGAFLRYDLRNLRVCCYHCNINLGGNGTEYYPRLVKEMGQEHVDQIKKDKFISIKADSWWYLEMIEKYKLL